MDDRIRRLLSAFGKINAPHIRNKSNGFNNSEESVFWAIAQIVSTHPEKELFSLSELNSFLMFTKPNLSQTVNKLEEKGMVERTMLKTDRRVTYICLTGQGKKVLKDKQDIIVAKMESIIREIGEDKIDDLIVLLEKFADIMP